MMLEEIFQAQLRMQFIFLKTPHVLDSIDTYESFYFNSPINNFVKICC